MSDRDYSTESTFSTSIPEMIIVTVSGCLKLNIRKEPTTTADVIAVLDNGEILERVVSSEDGLFSRVRLTSGKYGYAMTRYLKDV